MGKTRKQIFEETFTDVRVVVAPFRAYGNRNALLQLENRETGEIVEAAEWIAQEVEEQEAD